MHPTIVSWFCSMCWCVKRSHIQMPHRVVIADESVNVSSSTTVDQGGFALLSRLKACLTDDLPDNAKQRTSRRPHRRYNSSLNRTICDTYRSRQMSRRRVWWCGRLATQWRRCSTQHATLVGDWSVRRLIPTAENSQLSVNTQMQRMMVMWEIGRSGINGSSGQRLLIYRWLLTWESSKTTGRNRRNTLTRARGSVIITRH